MSFWDVAPRPVSPPRQVAQGQASRSPPRRRSGVAQEGDGRGTLRGPSRSPRAWNRIQYASELTTSPWFREAICHIVIWLVDALRNRTEPSPIATLAPPGW